MTAATSGTIKRMITVSDDDGDHVIDIYTPDGFAVLADLLTRSGWQRKMRYELTWLGTRSSSSPRTSHHPRDRSWRVRPDVMVECGVAHGEYRPVRIDARAARRRAAWYGVDVEIRKYNRLAIESHPLSQSVTLIEGGSAPRRSLSPPSASRSNQGSGRW